MGVHETNDALLADIEPFLAANEKIGPPCRPKLLEILRDARCRAMFKVEFTDTIDYGEPFVKACYFLEGNGHLVL